MRTGLANWVQAIDFKGSNLKAVANGFIGSHGVQRHLRRH